MALNKQDKDRTARVLEVFGSFMDNGADRAASLTLAFFVSEAAEAGGNVAFQLEQIKEGLNR